MLSRIALFVAISAAAMVHAQTTLGYTTMVPSNRDGTLRRCEAGECALGNIVADAYKWKYSADVGFENSGGLNQGWAEGAVTTVHAANAFRFTNQGCTGAISGMRLFQLVNFSISNAKFSLEDVSGGSILTQFSGLRATYNTNLVASKMLKLEIWRRNRWIDVDPAWTYTYATNDFMCGNVNSEFYAFFAVSTGKFSNESAWTRRTETSATILGDYLAAKSSASNYLNLTMTQMNRRFINATDSTMGPASITGWTAAMPWSRSGTLRACEAGECAAGNVITDAYVWKTNTDFAFENAGAIRTTGWAAGAPWFTDLYNIGFSGNTLCTGVVNGTVLVALISQALARASFSLEDVSGGSALLQVSGLEITYNTQLTGNPIVDLKINGATPTSSGKYTFTTNSFLCTSEEPYRTLLNLDRPVMVHSAGASHIGVVAQYLRARSSQATPFDPAATVMHRRLKNDTTLTSAFSITDGAQGATWIVSAVFALAVLLVA